ncbi:MAG: metallophosphoesterase [Acidobacteria bacterium]|nr:metallophosphoesterase [Acidobacteriota bacterium]
MYKNHVNVKRVRHLLLAVASIGTLLALYAFEIEPRLLVVRRDSIAIENFPPLRVALISDIHAGSPFIDDDKLRRIVTLTNAEHPDLILILGDSVIQGVTGGKFMPPEHAAEILGNLRARYGVVGVLGNHDGWLNATRVKAAYERAGIPTLVNETHTLAIGGRRLTLVGLADLMTGDPDLTLAETAPVPMIVMTHNPDVFPRLSNRATLTVAGHTHGGQVWLPFFGRLRVPSKYGQRYALGHVVEHGKHLYVTSGIGTSIIPIRFCVVPEIRLLDVREASRAPHLSPATPTAATP